MGSQWYNEFASRHGGYVKTWMSTIEGDDAEDVFADRLFALLNKTPVVLDAGCGHGQFTLQVAAQAAKVVGIDFAQAMIDAASRALADKSFPNVRFVCASTKGELPFPDEMFDIIYSRRGPTSICRHPRLLEPGGTMMGIHFPDTREII